MPSKCYLKEDEELNVFNFYQRASLNSKNNNHQHEIFIIQKNPDINSMKIEEIIDRNMTRAADQRCLYRQHLKSNRVVENKLCRNMIPDQFFKRLDMNEYFLSKILYTLKIKGVPRGRDFFDFFTGAELFGLLFGGQKHKIKHVPRNFIFTAGIRPK